MYTLLTILYFQMIFFEAHFLQPLMSDIVVREECKHGNENFVMKVQ